MRYCYATILFLFILGSCHSQIIQTKTYFDLDSTKIREIFHYKASDSTLHGSYEAFHINGSLQIFGWYLKNKPDSIWTYFYENGRKRASGRYKQGIPIGQWKYYFENSNLKSKGNLNGAHYQNRPNIEQLNISTI